MTGGREALKPEQNTNASMPSTQHKAWFGGLHRGERLQSAIALLVRTLGLRALPSSLAGGDKYFLPSSDLATGAAGNVGAGYHMSRRLLHGAYLGVAARAQRLEEDVVVDDVAVLEPASPDGRRVLQLLLLRELGLLAGDIGRVFHDLGFSAEPRRPQKLHEGEGEHHTLRGFHVHRNGAIAAGGLSSSRGLITDAAGTCSGPTRSKGSGVWDLVRLLLISWTSICL